MVATVAALSVSWSGGQERAAAWGQQSEDAVVLGGSVIVALLVVLALLSAVAFRFPAEAERSSRSWAFAGVAAGGVGAAMVGGLLVALLRLLVEDNRLLRGPAFVLFDVYGLAVLAGLAAAAFTMVRLLIRPSPGEANAAEWALLPNPMSWLRARLALASRALVAGLSATTLAFLVIGIPTYAARRDDELWFAGDTPPVHIAQATIYGTFAFMFVNLVRARVSGDALRRVGSVWDVLTFWPAHHHPFAVRSYAPLTVADLTPLLVQPAEGDPDAAPPGWFDEPLTVVAHSQGSMVVVLALAQLAATGRRSAVVHLVTVGSPLGALYGRAFPAQCGPRLLDAAGSGLADEGRWTNVFRFTDHVGRSVFCDDAAWAPMAGPAARRDRAIADPRRRQQPISGHNDYWDDDRVREVVRGA